VFKSHLIKSNHRVIEKNKVDAYGAPALQMIITLQFAKMFTNSHEHSMYIRFLCLKPFSFVTDAAA
jgi:hypothetical protein